MMKNKIIMLVVFLLAFAGKNMAVSIIEGTWAQTPSVYLYEVRDGQLHEIAISNVTDKDEFAFAFYPTKPGFFVLSAVEGGRADASHSFYLKPNDKLQFAVADFKYHLVGENTPENEDLNRWYNVVQPIEFKAFYFMQQYSTYVDFFPLLEEKVEENETFVPTSKNEEFLKQFAEFRRFNLMECALRFLYTPRAMHPQDEDYPDYYNEELLLSKIGQTATILDYPRGMQLLDMCKMFNNRSALEEDTPDAYALLDKTLKEITNPILKGEVVLNEAKGLRSFSGLSAFRNRYDKQIVSESQQERMKTMLINLAQGAEGEEAFDFTAKDVNGKSISLSDFKGKVVYVDVWATWCGPCRKEAPYWSKLVEDFADRDDIVFLGVSVDNVKDYETWKKTIASMKGIQVFAGEKADEDVMKPYKIKGIPRFILLGKDGKVIASDAPRASSSEIKVLLETTLQK